MRRRAITASAMLVLAACASGGGGTASSEPTDPGSSQAVPASQAPASVDAGNGDPGTSSGLGTATVTIGSETYRFGETSFPALRCDPDMFGIFWVLLGAVDETGAELPDGGVEIRLPEDGAEVSESARVSVSTADDDWIASDEIPEPYPLPDGSSGVDSYTISGNSVSGTATFYSENSYFASGSGGELVTAQGTFEATCNE